VAPELVAAADDGTGPAAAEDVANVDDVVAAEDVEDVPDDAEGSEDRPTA
jgi:hypothetical protein